MALLDRIANYFKEWDGIDDTAPKMELSIHDLRYIADMNVERCRLIKQLNQSNLKTEEIRNKAIDEFVKKMEEWNENVKLIRNEDVFFTIENIRKIAEQMKGGV